MNKLVLSNYSFQFRPILTVVAGISLMILIGLGVWQLQRLSWKQALIEKIEARVSAPEISLRDAVLRWQNGEDMEYTPVVAVGAFDHTHAAHIFGTLDGIAGNYIFTPLLDLNSAAVPSVIVYVNRGFAPQTFSGQSTGIETGAKNELYSVRGLFRTAEQRAGMAKLFSPEDQPKKNQFYTRNPKAFAKNSGFEAPSYYIDSFAVEGMTWPKGGTTRLNFRNNHLDYALTWFGLALVLVGIWLALSLKNEK